MKTIRIILSVLCLLLVRMSGYAQDETAAMKKQIADIKRNTTEYIYAEATAATREEARDQADEALYAAINAWMNKTSPGKTAGNTKSKWSSLTLPRGNMQRWFVYVKKSDLQAGGGTTLQVPEAVLKIAAIKEYAKLAATIEQMKANGQITSYARYAQLDDPTRYYLAVYNTSGQVVAVLTQGQNRMNVGTGQSDDVKNYKGCGAIGFTVK